MAFVALGEDGLVRRPRNGQVRVIPGNAALGRRIVVLGALVHEIGYITGDTEPVSKAHGNVELAVVFLGEIHTHPLAKGG